MDRQVIELTKSQYHKDAVEFPRKAKNKQLIKKIDIRLFTKEAKW